ncbi:hypothetical protein [Luteococcus sanguinis]|uniref:Uncharacterized protein n=1 Tax=Luteococcus sanguinis TaxID=174038 RepID=A0ABW1X1R4_9ACTN
MLAGISADLELPANPTDAYTRRLLASLPVPDPTEQAGRRAELARIAAEATGA